MKLELGKKYLSRSGDMVIEPMFLLDHPADGFPMIFPMICRVTDSGGWQTAETYRCNGSFFNKRESCRDAVSEVKKPARSA